MKYVKMPLQTVDDHGYIDYPECIWFCWLVVFASIQTHKAIIGVDYMISYNWQNMEDHQRIEGLSHPYTNNAFIFWQKPSSWKTPFATDA